MQSFQKYLELIALIFGALTFGTAYYLLFLAHPAWSSAAYENFLPLFQSQILKIGMSQIILSNIALVACVILFFLSRNWVWLLAVLFLLLSLPITMFLLMPINFAFIEATDPNLANLAPTMLEKWGQYQILRVIGDGLAFISMCIPVIWPKQTSSRY